MNRQTCTEIADMLPFSKVDLVCQVLKDKHDVDQLMEQNQDLQNECDELREEKLKLTRSNEHLVQLNKKLCTCLKKEKEAYTKLMKKYCPSEASDSPQSTVTYGMISSEDEGDVQENSAENLNLSTATASSKSSNATGASPKTSKGKVKTENGGKKLADKTENGGKKLSDKTETAANPKSKLTNVNEDITAATSVVNTSPLPTAKGSDFPYAMDEEFEYKRRSHIIIGDNDSSNTPTVNNNKPLTATEICKNAQTPNRNSSKNPSHNRNQPLRVPADIANALAPMGHTWKSYLSNPTVTISNSKHQAVSKKKSKKKVVIDMNEVD